MKKVYMVSEIDDEGPVFSSREKAEAYCKYLRDRFNVSQEHITVFISELQLDLSFSDAAESSHRSHWPTPIAPSNND